MPADPAAASAASTGNPQATAQDQRPLVSSNNGLQCREYNPRTESWDMFMQRFEFYLVGTRQKNIPDEEKQGIFVNICGPDVLRMANAVASPQTLGEISWTELKRKLQTHYSPKPSSLARRINFHKRVQAEGESIAEFLAALRVLATDCEFGDQLDWLIRDKLIMGIRDEKLRRRLATRPSLPLATAIEELLAAEATYPPPRGRRQDGVYMTEYWPDPDDDLVESQDGDINQVRTMRAPQDGAHHMARPPRGPKMAANSRQFPCVGCLGPHPRAQCPYLQSTCSYCSKKGHIFRACRAVPPPNQAIHQQTPAPPQRGPRTRTYTRGGHNSGRWVANIDEQQSEACLSIFQEIQLTSMGDPDTEVFSTSVSIDGAECDWQIDSGSPVTIMSWQDIQDLLPHRREEALAPVPTTLRDCQGKQIPLRGQITVLAKHNQTTAHLPIVVTERKFARLLGRGWIRRLKIQLEDVQHISTTPTTAALIGEFADVFNGELGKYRGTPISFNLDPSIPPIRLKPRRVPLALKPKVDEQLDKLIAQGILVPVDHAKWETPIVTPIKPDGSVRVCADYKCTVNKALQWNAYPVPVIQHLLHSLGQGKIFAKLDMAQAYQQLPVDDQTAEAQTVVTHRGAFKCTRLQFGVSTAPGIFQALMERLLQGIPGVTPYFDDVLVAAKDQQDLIEKLRATLQRFRDAGLKLNKNKCLIGVPVVEFLGFKIDAAGIHPTNKKTAAIHNAPPPSNKTELQAFLGLLNFYSMFLRQKATVAEPLHKLLNKSSPWKWGEAEHKAFEATKALITSDSLLVQYSEAIPVQLTCDASPYGVGAVLSHTFPNGHSAPIAYYSRTLTSAERNYSQLDKEALAAVAGVKRFHDYLYGRKFTLVTDHKPLLGIIAGDRQTPQVISPRMTRWLEFLAAYSYTLEYHPGPSIAHADALSRCPTPLQTPDPAPTLPLLLIEHITGRPVTADEIARHTVKDPILSTVLQWVLKGWPPQKQGQEFKTFEHKQTELSTQRGCLLWGHRVIIPTNLRDHILTEIHKGHLGIVRMKTLARSYVWWPNMDNDIELKSKHCQACQLTQAAPPAAPPSKWDTTQNPWSRLHIDFAGPIQGRMLFIIVDAHSNWIEVHPMHSATTEATINALYKTFTTHGIPDTIVSDNGPQFTAETFKNFLSSLGIRHTTAAPYRPMANGRAERAVRSVKEALARMSPGDFQTKINTFLLAQHSTPSPITNRSPAEILMGRKIKIPLSRVHPNDLPPPGDLPTPGVRTFLEGEGVYARNYPGPPKWVPGKISRITGPKSYEIKLPDGRTWRRHVDQIRGRLTGDEDPNRGEEDTSKSDDTDKPTHYLPEAYPSILPAAEAQLPPLPSPPPPQPSPPQNPRAEGLPGTSILGSSNGANELSLRRSTRMRQRPAYLKDYACAIETSRKPPTKRGGVLHPRMRSRSFHSGPTSWTFDPAADWLPR